MQFDATGMVMNSNTTELPRDCPAISGDHQFTVTVGTAYADDFPGSVFGMSQHEYQVPPCSRVTVTLVNEDQVRHQWMLHGLPLYLYPQGMFHLEAAGGQSQTGSFIVPGGNQTYLVHCDMTQHMEKGMKGQLKVGAGGGDLWSIPGISGAFRRQGSATVLGVAIVLSMAVMSFLVMAFIRKSD
jgi:plastocyanin